MNRLVFDIGGSHLRVAFADGGVLGASEKIATPKNPAQGVEVVRAFLEKHSARTDEIVGGIAGVVRDGVIVRTGYLPEWDGFNLSAALKATCGISARIFNDAEIAGVGEAVLGAGKGHHIVAYVTVGTGIGGALIVGGRPAPHAVGYEPGQQVIDYERMRSLEEIAGGASLTEEFGHPPEELEHAVVEGRVRALAVGLYNVLRLWSPDILILGGSLMNDTTGYPLDAVAHEIASLPVSLPVLPPIERSMLGDDAGLRGALVLVTDENN
jgi:predicted NBD/HSP70 family sugar kinase